MWATDRITLGIVTCIGTMGCAASPAPVGWLATADSAQRDPFGAWIEVTHVASPDAERPRTAGELIAVHEDTVFVLPPEGGLVAIPIDQIRRARLADYDSQWSLLALWTSGGVVSTISHGYVALVSAPVWIVGGSVATGAQSHAPIVGIGSEDRPAWPRARKYARFPQGVPDGVDRAGLLPKR